MRAGPVLIALCLAWPAVAYDSGGCPNPLTGNVRSGRYEFEFQSWSEGQGRGLLFCECVRNKSKSAALFVNWAGLLGFVAGGDVGFVMNPTPSLKKKIVQLPLWYGAVPTRVDVETTVPDDQAFLRNPGPMGNPIVKAADWRIAQSAASADRSLPAPPIMVSRSRVSVPARPYGPGWKEADIIQDVEKNPDILRRFDMVFESEPVVNADGVVTGIRDDCVYSLAGPDRLKTPLSLGFSDASLQQEVFGSPAPHALRLDQWTATGPGEARASSSGTRPQANVGVKQLVRRQALMQVMSGPVVLASVPVTYYAVASPTEPPHASQPTGSGTASPGR
jgi:hypothetical protein